MQMRAVACQVSALVLILALMMLVSGCGRKASAGATASETAEAFAKALESGDLDGAAKCFDYVTQARSQNEDWDTIASGQRDLIVKKLRGDKAPELAALQTRLGANVTVGAVQNATAQLSGDAGSIKVGLREVDGKWYVAGVW